MTTIANTAEQATEHVKDAASQTRKTLLELSTQVMKLINGAREAEGRGVDAVLDRLGLQRRRSAFEPMLWIAGGALVAGAAVFLMTSPSGQPLRQRISRLLDGVPGTIAPRAEAVEPQPGETKKSRPNGAKHEVG